MVDVQESLNRLRHLAYVPPSRAGFVAICEVLEKIPHKSAQFDVCMEYALGFLDAQWPDEDRICRDDWAMKLLRNEYEPRVVLARRLALSSHALEDEAIANLCKRPEFRPIVYVDVSYNRLTCASIVSLGRCPFSHNLRSLDVSFNRIEDRGARGLGQYKAFRSLERLILTGNEIGTRGARYLAQSKNLGNLKRFEIRDNPMGYDGARALEDAETIPKAARKDWVYPVYLDWIRPR